MAERDFYSQEAKTQVRKAIEEVEAQTSAELVVAVRHFVASYRAADYLFGFAAAMGVLLILLFHPREFLVETMPLDVAVAFALGALVCARSSSLRRLLTPRAQRRRNLVTGARAVFVELGVSRTRGRGGILVLAGMLERGAAVVADTGVDTRGAAWVEACGELDRALAGADLGRFLTALRALGPLLGRLLPAGAGDSDELPNEISAS